MWYRLRALFRRRAVETELDEELRFHLDKAAEAYVREGVAPDEAMRRARLDLGGVESVKEDVRDARGVRLIYDIGADLRYGVRVLRRAPAFTIVAILTLALGIGANTAMFAVVDDVLMHPIPYDKPEQLVRLHGSNASFERASISYPNFLDWQSANRSFSSIAVAREGAFTLTGAGTAERIHGELVSTDYFAVLGVAPLFGHAFAATEEPVALLAESLWRRKFAGATDVVGRTVILDGKSYTVVGVMPARADLRGVGGGDPADLYLPITQLDREALKRRGAGLGIHGIARLKPDTTIDQARADLEAITSHLAATYPETNRGVSAVVDPLDESVVGNLRPYLLVLFAAVGLVLLIACVNVANLLLARSAVRSHELAIRVAVGASFGRLMRQLLTESLLLAWLGGAFGLLVSSWSTDALLALLPGRLSRVSVDSFDPRVLVFTIAISLVAGLLCGLVPALKAIRPNLHGTIKEGGRGFSTRSRPQAVFIVLQTALAVVLLVGAGLLVRTMVQLSRESPGYDPDGIVTFGLSLAPAMQTAPPATVRAALRDLDAALASTPGVESAAFAYGAVPIEGSDQWTFWVDGRPKPVAADQMSIAVVSIVGPEYLTAMKIPLLRGRFFTERDDPSVPDVVVIDESFARQHFPDEDPVGKRIRIGDDPVEIIGVAGHVKMWGLDQEERQKVSAQMYFSFRQLADSEMPRASSGIVVVARTRGDRAAVVQALHATVERLGGDNVMFRVRTADEIITGYQATRRFAMYVLGAFAALALLLCTIGIYGVVSYLVARRTTEIGIRMALGATASIIMRLILRDGMKLTIAGVAIGLVAACFATRFMSSLLFGVSALDLVTFSIVAATVIAIALCALLVPARRATRLDVLQALRAE